MNATVELHVIIGSGALGMALSRELLARRKRVRMVNRSGVADVPTRVYVFRGNAADPATLREACEDATVIYHCAQPSYKDWVATAPALMDGVIEAAAVSGARVVYADSPWAYGPEPGPLTEELRCRPSGVFGAVRARLAARLMEAHQNGRVRATIGRAADFFGPFSRTSLLGRYVFDPAMGGRTIRVPGDPDLPHTYTYIDDFARGLVVLAERDESLGQAWHVPSAETVTTRCFVEMVLKELGAQTRLQVAPRSGFTVRGWFDPAAKALNETRQQRDRPFVLGHGKFQTAFGAETTPHPEAIRKTLEWWRQNPA